MKIILFLEYEAGFALPSLVTGKLGIGKKFNNTKVIVGVRPFPFNLYLQSSFTKGKKDIGLPPLNLTHLIPIHHYHLDQKRF